ncbi:gamma-glutamylcyclotransferase family protein [Reyranella sp.]|uniref:gamma-glutamylcyclotransferase family protein n=1 Tax=Reyranella sp. TaxID=1929291 RepID=UPI0011FAF6B6|nr:MAG: gamma-glutamylcyclotransferase [Reyranella sp.]
MNEPGSLVRLASRLILPTVGYRHLFAYARFLDIAELRAIGLQPHFVTLARYKGRRWIINESGEPTIVPRRGHQVFGIIWKVREVELAALDILEGVPHLHERYGSFATTAEGVLCISEFYCSKDQRLGVGSASLLAPILSSARHWGFTREYIDELAQWASARQGEPVGALNESVYPPHRVPPTAAKADKLR